jgi:hypothetical protein
LTNVFFCYNAIEDKILKGDIYMPDFIVIDEMSSHINEKVQELKRSMGLSHQE